MNIDHTTCRTRLAPTPSGYLHLGNIFSFVLTVALARKAGAKILLRIDDYDRERVTARYIQDIFDTLHFLEIPYDEGPSSVQEFEAHYAQRNREHLYAAAMKKLVHAGQLFACTCSRAEILRVSQDGVYPGTCGQKKIAFDVYNTALRVHTPEKLDLQIRTLTGSRHITRVPSSIKDFVVRKKDGTPAYQLCSLIDDLHFGVDLVVRGSDLWPSTVAQHYLSVLLNESGFTRIGFLHHQILADSNGKKMSKSAGAESVYQLRKQGKKRAEIFALIARMLGYNEQVCNWQSLAAVIETNKVFPDSQLNECQS